MLLAAGLVCALAFAVAVALRPWRTLAPGGPPWPWFAWCALMPVLWTADRWSAMPAAQPLSGACLLLLLAGWPLATLALLPVALLAAGLGQLGPAEVLERALWLGLAPATVALLLGSAVRRFAPRHLFVYIFGRGFLVPVLANLAAGSARALASPLPPGLALADLLVARWLTGWGDAVLTGMITAIFVAFRPQWLATYTDRLYLPIDHRGGGA